MEEYRKHLYMIVFPINALVASQLEPRAFAEHYTIGSAKHFKGKVIFNEVDPEFRDAYFPIDEFLAKTVPHEDGSPKRTKFISSYRVLEHVPLSAIRSMFLVTTNGQALELAPAEFTSANQPERIRIYQEIAPVRNLVASRLDQRGFGKYVTIDSRAKGAPKVCFTQIDLNVEEFIAESSNRDILASPIPENNPYRLLDCLLELNKDESKMVKTVSLSSVLQEVSYRMLRHGFWYFDESGEMIFFPMPGMQELESVHYDWWKHVR